MINVTKIDLDGVLEIQTHAFEDYRGEYLELYNEKLYQNHGISVNFVQDDISSSSRHILRGIHGDDKTWKLVSCLYGKFYFVVVNCDTASAEFGRWQSWTLSDRNRLQILVPPKYGNAHLIMSEMAIFHYKQSTYYDRAGQFTYKWHDPKFNIWWPVVDPILSIRDA